MSELLNVRVKRWHGVALWRWDYSEETCAVCQFSFDECCPKCRFPGDDCGPVKGKCGHVYHRHCCESITVCPLCRAAWEIA